MMDSEAFVYCKYGVYHESDQYTPLTYWLNRTRWSRAGSTTMLLHSSPAVADTQGVYRDVSSKLCVSSNQL
jgi:hypothetical protein